MSKVLTPSGLGPNELEVARERLTPVAAPAEDLIKSTTDSLDGMQVQDFREAIQDAKPLNDPLSEDSNENMQKLRAKL